jgi:hypothetical protein
MLAAQSSVAAHRPPPERSCFNTWRVLPPHGSALPHTVCLPSHVYFARRTARSLSDAFSPEPQLRTRAPYHPTRSVAGCLVHTPRPLLTASRMTPAEQEGRRRNAMLVRGRLDSGCRSRALRDPTTTTHASLPSCWYPFALPPCFPHPRPGELSTATAPLVGSPHPSSIALHGASLGGWRPSLATSTRIPVGNWPRLRD